MPIFEVRPDGLTPVPATSFETVGIRERNDLQRLLREQIECLESGLIVLTEEFSWWVDSSLDNLKIIDSGRAITKDQMESLGCVATRAAFHAQCLQCNLDKRYAFIAVTLPKSIEKIWARKEDFRP